MPVLAHGMVVLTPESDLDEVRAQFNDLAKLGIHPNAVTPQLLDESAQYFAESYDSLIRQPLSIKNLICAAGFCYIISIVGENG